jgi:hypothetical protein
MENVSKLSSRKIIFGKINHTFMMNTYDANWNKEELLIYILIYCANSDHHQSGIETSFIKSKVKNSDYDKLKEEFDKDSPFARIQKIKDAYEKNEYSLKDKEKLFDDMRELFLSDGRFSNSEQKLFHYITNIIEH